MPASVGMPVTSVRELRVLQTCQHDNLVELKGVVTGTKLDRCAPAAFQSARLQTHQVHRQYTAVQVRVQWLLKVTPVYMAQMHASK